MNGDLCRIGLGDTDENNKTAVMLPDGLSNAGRVFWDFLHESQVATGNDPRAIVRGELLRLFRADLSAEKSAEERFMEDDHGYIQWLFPLETRGVNRHAPVMMSTDHEVLGKNESVKKRIYEHFVLFMEFMGLRYDPADGSFLKVNADQWASWIENGHNNLRINRILCSMKNFGLGQVARDFLQFLSMEAQREELEMIDGKAFVPFHAFTRESWRDYWSKSVE